MNHWALIGHRGVGKTRLLENLRHSFPNFVCLSLDQEIERTESRSIKHIFATDGEEAFRKIENKVFDECVDRLKDQSFVIDLGAGFSGNIPKKIKCLWVRRKGLTKDSIFLDRPNLDGALKIDPSRFDERTARYSQMAAIHLQLREGIEVFQKGELDFFRALFSNEKSNFLSKYFLTITDETTAAEQKVLQNLGIAGFEYRDDLKPNIEPDKKNALYSLRKNQAWVGRLKGLWDWPMEWGENIEAPILSCHKKAGSLQSTIDQLPQTEQIIKLAVPVENFSELIMGHLWMQGAPESRVFLPHSENGRWAWYRQWTAKTSPLQFIRLDHGSAPDQPSILQVLNQNSSSDVFAAILGCPVSHSWTPTFHQKFFHSKNADVFAIEVHEKEWDQALPVLQELGLRWAAVTSPLKQRAGQWVGNGSPLNTLCLTDAGWKGTNTDDFGFAKSIQKLQKRSVAVWGGGGTLASMVQVLPNASFYSSRTGKIKHGDPHLAPENLIWAVSAEAFNKTGVFPPLEWPLRSVVDLNYNNDSPGIECAAKFGCQYSSGMVMFVAQAERQQEFWNECRIK